MTEVMSLLSQELALMTYIEVMNLLSNELGVMSYLEFTTLWQHELAVISYLRATKLGKQVCMFLVRLANGSIEMEFMHKK